MPIKSLKVRLRKVNNQIYLTELMMDRISKGEARGLNKEDV